MALSAYKKVFITKRGPRVGLFLRYKKGHLSGVAEYTPLPGIHTINLDDAWLMTKDFEWENVVGQNFSVLDLRDYFRKFSYPLSYLLSQVHFSKKCLEESFSQSVELSGLIESIDKKESLMQAQVYHAQGYNTLKVKVGGLPLEEELLRLDELDIFNLRLDANQRLDLNTATALLNQRIEYLEEPLLNIIDAQVLRSLVPLAMDETFGPAKNLYMFKNLVDVLVLKPSRFHSLYEVMALALEAQNLGIKVVLSHCFESELSTAIFAFLAYRLKLCCPQGILANDLFAQKAENQIYLADAQNILGQYL